MRKSPTKRIRELTAWLNQRNHEYYNLNAPTVSDAVYDRHFDELKRLEDAANCRMANSPTQTVGYAVVSSLPKTAHKIPLLSLEKIKTMSGLMRFIGSHQVLVMQKLDGLTVKLEYENGELIRASTRGNGDEGEVITHNARAIDGIPGRIPYNERLVVVGEAFISKPTFEKLKDVLTDSSGNHFKNARNMAAGAVRNHNAETCAERGVQFSPFSVLEGLDEGTNMSNAKNLKLEILQNFGFTPCEFRLLRQKASEQEVDGAINELRTLANNAGIPIDGIVITYNDVAFSRSCGRTGHHYKDGLAFKFDDDLHETIFRSIEWTPGRSGELAPVALFDTVEIDGCEVSRASVHNWRFIRDLELAPGCRILVSKRNMIIPHIEANLDLGRFNADAVYPKWCPCCRSKTWMDKAEPQIIRCENTNCAAQLVRKFVHFVGKKAMNIEGLSEATLEKFIKLGFLKEFADIYRLDNHALDICKIDGFGSRSWERLWNAIQQSRKTTFVRYLVAMDIPLIGRTASRALDRHFNGDLNTLEMAVKSGFNFTQLPDFGEVLHNNIHDWFAVESNLKLWKGLRTLVFIEDTNTGTATEATPFFGKTVVVTGKLEHFTRNTINAKIEELGAKAGSAVSSNTDYLVCGDKAGSKLDKARELGVMVLTEQEFISMADAA